MIINRNYRIKNVITYFFLTAAIIIIAVTMISAFLLNQHEIKLIRENNLTKIHDTLGHLIAPSVDISDGTAIIRQLSLASDRNQFFVVIDNNMDIFASNTGNTQLAQKYLGNSIKNLTCNNDHTFYKSIDGASYWIKCSNLQSSDIANNKNIVGILLSFSNNILLPTFSLGIYSLVIAMITILLIGFWFRSFLSKYLLKPLIQLSAYIQNNKENEMQSVNYHSMPLEIRVIKDVFENLLIELAIENNKRIEYEKRSVLLELAAQVAHDMRSPLLAVDSFLHLIEKKLDEPEKIFGKRAVSRLNDIAWSLLSKYKKKDENHEIIEDNYLFLSSCIQELLAEKRMEYVKESIEFEFSADSDNIFNIVHLNAVNLKRALSNLINNAVNSIVPNKGQIKISLNHNMFGHLITIRDNGSGMRPEVLQSIMESVRNEKAKTNLGLPHAVKFFTSIGGKLDMESTIGTGTTVYASLPNYEIPAWCVKNYSVCDDDLLLIIDDCQSVHDVWDEMLKKIPDVQYQHFYTPDDALAFFKATAHKHLVIFCDYEFFGADQNGVDILSQAPEGAVRFLVTSHLYNPKIMQAAIEKGFNILPKDLAPHFRLNKSLPKNRQDEVRLIFIDNEKGNTDDWQFFADHHKINIVTYNIVADFLKDADRFSRHIPIYIDLDLGEEKNGIEYAKDIYALGFETIYIATGAVDDRLNKADYPWITDILDKKPPF